MSKGKVIIMRGVPGSGKTYKAVRMMRDIMCSADDYFTNKMTGKYEFKIENIGFAHEACMVKFLKYLNFGIERPLIVDNTNISIYECAPYYQVASALGFDVELITIVCDPKVAIGRQKHGVPAAKVYLMSLILEEQTKHIPTFWNHRVVFEEEL